MIFMYIFLWVTDLESDFKRIFLLMNIFPLFASWWHSSRQREPFYNFLPFELLLLLSFTLSSFLLINHSNINFPQGLILSSNLKEKFVCVYLWKTFHACNMYEASNPQAIKQGYLMLLYGQSSKSVCALLTTTKTLQ